MTMKYFIVFFLLIFSCATTTRFTFPDKIYCKSSNKKAQELFENGRKSLSMGMYEHAQKFFYYAAKEDSNFCDANFYLGYTYRLNDEWKYAANYYIEAYETNNKVPHFVQNLGHALLVLGYYKKSLEVYLHLTEIDPNNPEGFYGVALAQEAQNIDSMAIKNLNQSIKLYNSKKVTIGSEVNYLMGILYSKTGKYQHSISELEKVYGDFEEQAEMNYYLGMSYFNLTSDPETINLNLSKKYLKKARKLGVEIAPDISAKLKL